MKCKFSLLKLAIAWLITPQKRATKAKSRTQNSSKKQKLYKIDEKIHLSLKPKIIFSRLLKSRKLTTTNLRDQSARIYRQRHDKFPPRNSQI